MRDFESNRPWMLTSALEPLQRVAIQSNPPVQSPILHLLEGWSSLTFQYCRLTRVWIPLPATSDVWILVKTHYIGKTDFQQVLDRCQAWCAYDSNLISVMVSYLLVWSCQGKFDSHLNLWRRHGRVHWGAWLSPYQIITTFYIVTPFVYHQTRPTGIQNSGVEQQDNFASELPKREKWEGREKERAFVRMYAKQTKPIT